MNITELLEVYACWYEYIPHQPVHSAQHLAHELHVPGREVAKTVLLRAEVTGGHELIVAVLPASKNVDLKLAADLVHSGKVELATELEIARKCQDCDFGVLPPFGSRYGMKTIVDASLTNDEDIWFEGNTRRDAIRMKFSDFRRLENPQIAEFAAST
jgi:Ala-tRNA(Pro) deacylase